MPWPSGQPSIDSPCECEHNNPDSHDREDASSMVTAGATANTTEENSRASRESGLLCSHSHGESIALRPKTRKVRS